MSLLTEEEVQELSKVISKAQTELTYKQITDIVDDWSETKYFSPIWEYAPHNAVKAVYSISWYDKNGEMVTSRPISESIKPTTPHPHAEIIAKYAEVAARRCDPWVEFEWTSGEVGSEDWKVCHEVNTGFNYGRRYRHIGDKSDPMTARKGDDKPWNLNRDD